MRFLILPSAGPRIAAAFRAVSAAFMAVSAALSALALLFGLAGCSLSLEDPEVEARKKLAKLVEPSWELLEGRWLGDSTYTIFDTRATSLANAAVMDFFPDTTVYANDSTRLVFPGAVSARAFLATDTLRLDPAPLAGARDTLLVRLRFLGNWLELDRSQDQRFSHFHKVKPFDSLSTASLLDSGLWLRVRQRTTHDTTRIEGHRVNFDYLGFSGDSMHQETRRNGLARKAAGPLKKDGLRWTWSPPTGARTVHLDLFHADSLRLWPYNAGRPDSGFSLYTRIKNRPIADLDVTAYMGEMRSDTIRIRELNLENHFGRYYDLVLGEDYLVAPLTNMPDMPRFTSWSMDSGFLWMEGAGIAKTRFSVEMISAKRWKLTSDSGHAFPRPTTLFQTLVDAGQIAAKPLERFEQAGYMQIAVGSDTLSYFFLSASNRTSPEEHEIARIDSTDTLWAAWRVNSALETYGSSQTGFLFAFAGKTADLGKFTCKSVPSLDLALRTTASADPSLAKGLVQGKCRIIASEKAPLDSALSITGQFQSKRRASPLRAPFWVNP